MQEKLEAMLGDEQETIRAQLCQVTRDPPLVRAEIRAELLRELITHLSRLEPGCDVLREEKRPDWVELDINYT